MKWAYYVKYKLKVASALALILGLILFSILSGRQRFADLNQSVSSIYQDRLMPSTYIFEITDHLYQKRLLQEEALRQNSNMPAEKCNAHNTAIASLIKRFENTVLTAEEKQSLDQFKNYLHVYDNIEKQVLSRTDNSPIPKDMTYAFNNAMNCLGSLSKIQAGEGMHLTKDSKSIINGTVTTANFEVALLIVLGLYALVLLSVSDKVLFPAAQKQVWN